MSHVDLARYRFFRAHKYVTYRLFDFEGVIAKADFADSNQVLQVKAQFSDLDSLMTSHAFYEDNFIFTLLKAKGSSYSQALEAEHQHHEQVFKSLGAQLDSILETTDLTQRVSIGYAFYIAYRAMLGDMLHHLNQEETTFMAELHKRYTDDELKAVERSSYHVMTAEQLIHMLEQLFPHMDSHDKTFFLTGIQEAEPEKYKEVAAHFSMGAL